MLFSWFVTKMLVYSAAFVNNSSFRHEDPQAQYTHAVYAAKAALQWVGGAVGCFCRQAGGEAVPLPAPVHKRAAGGSLSSGPWNKCLACGYGADIHSFIQLCTYPSFYPSSNIHLFLHQILHVFTHIEAISNYLSIIFSNIFSIFVTRGIDKLSTIIAYSQIFDRRMT